MADEQRVSRKQQERKKGWIGIAVMIFAAGVLFTVIHFARSIGDIPGIRYYIYFEDSVAGLLRNSKIKYRGVEAGRVVGITLTDRPRVLVDGQVQDSSVTLLSPMVEVEIAINNVQASINHNSRAFLKTNPLSGMQQIDINDAAAGLGQELLPVPGDATRYACKLWSGGIDMDTWIDATIDSHKAGSVTAIEFSTPPGAAEPMADVLVTLPFRYRNLDASAYVAWPDASVDKGVAYINLVGTGQQPPGVETFPVRRAGAEQLVISLPAAAIAIDPALRGAIVGAGTPGGPRVARLQQDQSIGSTGTMVKYLHLEASAPIDPVAPDRPEYSRWVGLKRSLVEGMRYFEIEILYRGKSLPEGSPIEVARSPLTVLMERAEVIAEAIDYFPSIARNLEAAAGNIANLTTDLRGGFMADLRGLITTNSDKLGELISKSQASLLERIKEIGEKLGTQVDGLGGQVKDKIDNAFDEPTIANFKTAIAKLKEFGDSAADWRAGISAARAGFEAIREIVGLKSGDGQTVAMAIDKMADAFGKVNSVMADNNAAIADLIQRFTSATTTFEEFVRNLMRDK